VNAKYAALIDAVLAWRGYLVGKYGDTDWKCPYVAAVMQAIEDIILDDKKLGGDSEVRFNDPWLRFLWDLRGTYNGTLIDFEARREELEEMFREPKHGETPCQTSASAPAKVAGDP